MANIILWWLAIMFLPVTFLYRSCHSCPSWRHYQVLSFYPTDGALLSALLDSVESQVFHLINSLSFTDRLQECCFALYTIFYHYFALTALLILRTGYIYSLKASLHKILYSISSLYCPKTTSASVHWYFFVHSFSMVRSGTALLYLCFLLLMT